METYFMNESFSSDDDDSDYCPSEEEPYIPYIICRELLENVYEDTPTFRESVGYSIAYESDDDEYWPTPLDKKQWIQHYRAANQAHIEENGCPIDTLVKIEKLHELRKQKRPQILYRCILGFIVLFYLFVLAKTSISRYTSMIPLFAKYDNTKVQLELELQCTATLKELATSRNEDRAVEKAKQKCGNALNAAKASKSPTFIQRALISHGDLYSILNDYELAEKYYAEAAETDSKAWKQLIRLKRFSNDCLSHIVSFRYAALRSQCHEEIKTNSNGSIQKLANIWLSVFEKKVPIREALRETRYWTFTRLPLIT